MEWDDYGTFIIIALLAVLVGAPLYLLYSSGVFNISFGGGSDGNVPFENELLTVNFGVRTLGNYTTQFQILNPYENMSIRVYTYLFSDPEGAVQFAWVESSVKNGTQIQPLQSILATVTLHVLSDAEDYEYYVKVGWVQG